MSVPSSPGSAPGSGPAVPTPPPKKRNPIERVFVWGLILVMAGLVTVEAYSKFTYDATVKGIEEFKDESDKDDKRAAIDEYDELVSGSPRRVETDTTDSEESDVKSMRVDYTWFSLFKTYHVVLSGDFDDEGTLRIDRFETNAPMEDDDDVADGGGGGGGIPADNSNGPGAEGGHGGGEHAGAGGPGGPNGPGPMYGGPGGSRPPVGDDSRPELEDPSDDEGESEDDSDATDDESTEASDADAEEPEDNSAAESDEDSDADAEVPEADSDTEASDETDTEAEAETTDESESTDN